MKNVDIFVCSDAEIRACASWQDAFDSFPVTGITLPGELDFASLGQLLTRSAAPAITPVSIPGRELYVFAHAMGQALDRLAADDLADSAVAWAQTPPWAGLEVNPFDLAGFLMALQSAWRQSAAPDKALYVWPGA